MICPNCGAELEQHAFVHVCPYCGYISADNIHNDKPKVDSGSYHPYKNILGNLDTIQQSEFIELIQKADGYECISAKPFYPNDGHFHLDKSFELRWYARVTKHGFSIALLAKSRHADSQNHICIKTDKGVLALKQDGENRGYKVFPLIIDDFLYICTSSDIELDTNIYENAFQYDYEELVTYSCRFYHLIIDKDKYVYSLYQPLLID
ncbi:MAG: hypothetical protein IKO26_05670 [Paludibacteraceae bacterium]|nr:hypothetical protein [Paludibacteraceae bacterium]